MYYYCVVHKISTGGATETYLMADNYEIIDGCLIFTATHKENKYHSFSFAPGQWIEVHPASMITGDIVNCEHYRKAR